MWIDSGLRRVLFALVFVGVAVFVAQNVQSIVGLLLGILLFLFIAKLARPSSRW